MSTSYVRLPNSNRFPSPSLAVLILMLLGARQSALAQKLPREAPKPQERCLFTLKGHTGEVLFVSFDAKGEQLASSGRDQLVNIWHATTGKKLTSLVLKDRFKDVYSVAFSPDYTRLVSGGGIERKSGETIIWDVVTKKQLMTLRGATDAVVCVVISPDGKLIGSCSYDSKVRIYNSTSGKELFVLKGHVGQVYVAAFNPSGKILATGGMDRSLKLWDTTKGTAIRTLAGHTDAVWGAAFSNDGLSFASSGNDNTIRIWEVATGKLLRTLKGHSSFVCGVSFSPDDRLLASASADNTIKLWDPSTGKDLLTLKGHTDRVRNIAFTPDGHRLASASWDKTVKIWDVSDVKAR